MAASTDPTTARTLTAAAAGTFLVLVAFTTPLSTLPTTAADVHAGASAQAWILSGMSVGCAAGLLGSGALGDDYGRRRTFLAGALILAAGSVLAAVAADALLLVLARIVQGLGGAAVVACSLGLIGHAYPGHTERARATGIWGAALGAGVSAGPFLALALQTTTGWRSAYAITALLAADRKAAAADSTTGLPAHGESTTTTHCPVSGVRSGSRSAGPGAITTIPAAPSRIALATVSASRLNRRRS